MENNLFTIEQREILDNLQEPMTKTEAIIDVLDGMSYSDKVDIWNEYAQDTGDEMIFQNGECFFEEMFSTTDEAVRAVCYGEYHYTDEYVRFNAYGNLETTNYPSQWIDDNSLADWIADNDTQDTEFDMSEVEDIMRADFNDYLGELGYSKEQIEGFVDYDMDSDFESNFEAFKEYLTREEA